VKKLNPPLPRRTPCNWDLNDFLHPARAFAHPRHVVRDADLTLNEKRALLALWASDARAIETAPHHALGATQPVRLDDVMDALRALDQQAESQFHMPPHYRQVLENRVPGIFGRKSRNQGPHRHGPSIN
jgi:hypothetical protein